MIADWLLAKYIPSRAAEFQIRREDERTATRISLAPCHGEGHGSPGHGKRPGEPGLDQCETCWGTWTRTKNNGTRNRRVANYTIPQ